MIQSLTYKDWTILAMPVGIEWQFACCRNAEEPLILDRRYASPELAIAAAKCFVDCTEIRIDLGNLLDTWLEAGKISHEQYFEATGLIAELVRLTISDLTSIAPKQLEPPAQNPPDPSL